MSANEILITIKQLPLSEQKQILEELSQTVAEAASAEQDSEAEVVRLLLAKGLITEVPNGIDDEDDDFEPIEVTGKPVSETIIEERR